VSGDGGQAAGRPFDPTTTSIMPSEVVTRVLLLRHGEVEDFGKRVVRGQLDAPLSPAGVEQHVRLVAWLARHEARPNQLYTSDLVRCGELAQRLEELWSLPATVTKLLREQSLGRWQGRTWEEISAEDGALVTAYWDDYANTRPPGGESLIEMSRRVSVWLEATLAKHPGEFIAVSTHIGVIRALLCSLLDVSPAGALRFAPAVASTTEILISEAGAVITRLGERPWMWSAEP
jgi:broad specificity phosphatase PhoE